MPAYWPIYRVYFISSDGAEHHQDVKARSVEYAKKIVERSDRQIIRVIVKSFS